MKDCGRALRMFLWMTVLTGLVYPLLVTAFAQLTMKEKANGGLVFIEGQPVGAELIGQKFTSSRYFWGRPSAIDYHPLPSGGSNLGPTSRILQRLVNQRRQTILQAHDLKEYADVPSDLLYASGSGLDPHISTKTARFQIARVAKARGFPDEEGQGSLEELVSKLTEESKLGGSYVNVLRLNIALDELKPVD